MASPLLLAAVLLLTSEATAGPTTLWLFDGIQSGFQAGFEIGLKLVSPEVLVTRQGPPCQDCKGRNYFGLMTPPTVPCCPPIPTTTPGTCLKCGVERTLPPRIIGGNPTYPGKYPWIAVFKNVRDGYVGGCAATLVSSDWAITAAHCVETCNTTTKTCLPKETKSSMTLILGEHIITDSNDMFDVLLNREEVRLDMDPFIHPKYDGAHDIDLDYDIALLKLESVDLELHTPACLPAPGPTDVFADRNANVYGWGDTARVCGNNLPPQSPLLEAEVTIIKNADCAKPYTLFNYNDCNGNLKTPDYSGAISDRMVCGLDAGADFCSGDSGGPLTVESGGRHTLAGVVSRNYCELGVPGVYTNVANRGLRKWMDRTIKANGDIGKQCLFS